MSILDKVGLNVANTGRIISQKAKNSSEASALSREQNKEKKLEKNMLEELGQLYYERFKNIPDADFAAQISAITACRDRISKLNDAIIEVQSREPELVHFTEEPRPAAPSPSAMVCLQCGMSYTNGSKACAMCGADLVPQHAAKSAPEPDQGLPNKNLYSQRSGISQQANPRTQAAIFCPYCGTKAENDHAFCSKCGKKFD